MTIHPTSREKETRELIERLRARSERHKKMATGAAVVGGVVVLAIVVALVVMVTRGPDDGAGAGSCADSSLVASTGVTASGAGTASSVGAASSTTAASSLGTASSTTASLPTGGSSTTVGSSTTILPTTSTTARPSTTMTARATTSTVRKGNTLVVVIDPGHQAKGDSSGEPVGPGSSETKAKVSSGTAGVVTGTPESRLVLAVSLKLRDALAAQGITVVMTRTTENVNLSNIQRAQIANEAHADLFVRIHADGSDDHSVSGIHVLYPASIKGWTDDIAAASKRAAALAQQDLVAATGAKDRGIDARSDMTGFNWSDVPVILPEIGFMTNQAEDKLLATAAYQDKIVQGLTKAILTFLGVG